MSNKDVVSIMEKYEAYLTSYLRRTVKNEQDIQDIMQELWLCLLSRGKADIFNEKVCGYLRQTLNWVKLDYYRANNKTKAADLPEYEHERIGAVTVHHPDFDRDFFEKAVKMACKDFRKPDREYVTLHLIEGVSVTEICFRKGLCDEAVKIPIRRCKRNLRKIYREYA